ncbi:class I SAM-dependent methyltransferase [Nocardioides sp. J54]|uniref:class I SAM-dependent methyltransferase n=1 Tax=Nocardioides sp. J54 TaxID=935866 RepID=UPI0004B56661|nr:class I SAM-dependent methyltransferase [Nocardioides sp. J54]
MSDLPDVVHLQPRQPSGGPTAPGGDADVAPRLERALRPFVGGDLPVRLVAWDGSTAGPDVAPVVELRSPDALRRLLWHPGELGAAQAYVTGELEVRGDLDTALRRGVADRVEIRLCDYRDAVPAAGDERYDAVASLEMGEHVGQSNYPTYARVLHDAVRPGGRVLVQQMSRSGRWPGGGPFIESFIAPDMHMRPVGETVALLEASGLEARDVHALREHYVLTVAGWLERFEANVDALAALVGEELVRVWRLYLVGGSMAFRDGRMGVDQVLLVRPGAAHGLPWRRSS